MRNKFFPKGLIFLKIGFIIVSVLGTGCNSPSGSNANSNTNANTSSNSESSPRQDPNSINYSTIKSEFENKVKANCRDKTEFCDDLINIQLILENQEYTDDTFKSNCLVKITPELLSNTKKTDFIDLLKNGCKGNYDELKEVISKLKSANQNPNDERLKNAIEQLNAKNQELTTKVNTLTEENAQLKKSNDDIIFLKLLVVPLLLAIIGLIANQIWRFSKLQTLSNEIKESIVGNQGVNWTISQGFSGLDKSFEEKLNFIGNSLNQINQSVGENVNEKLNELITRKENEKLNESSIRKEDVPQNNSAESYSVADTTSSRDEQTNILDNPSDSLLGLVSDILDRFPDKAPLTKHPIDGKILKPTTSSSETVFYHRISITENEQEKNYAIPKFPGVNNEGQVRVLEDFYTFMSSQTGGLNGKLEIKRAAEIFWDGDNQAWRLNENKKGIISVKS